ncbi:MAG: DUF3794 domain-containing protein [Oscillospiraceae bacterium]
MDFNTKTNEVTSKQKMYEGNVEQAIDSDITMPEYFPDIVRILKCSLSPQIASISPSGDRVTAEGTAILSILYISDDEKIHCFEQKIPFSRYLESKLAEGCTVTVTPKTDYVNCRVVSSRRIDIHASMTFNFKAYKKSSQKLICDCEGVGIEAKKQKFIISNLSDYTEKPFQISETLEIGASKPSIAQLIRSDAVAIIEDVKIVSGKILIKGELTIKTLYISDDDTDELQRIENSMPISQIIEIETDNTESTDNINLYVASLEVSAKTDSAGALRLLEMSAVLRAEIEMYQDVQIEGIKDAYSTKYETEQKRENIDFKSINEHFTDTYLCRGSIQTPSGNITKIIDMSCAGITKNIEFDDNEMAIKGTITLNLLASDEQNQINYVERQFDYEYRRNLSVKTSSPECNPNVTVTGINYILSADDKIDVRVEIFIGATVFNNQSLNLITEIEIDEKKEKLGNPAALTIYFSEEGESVWEIARKYNTTVDAIMNDNKLTGEIVPEKCKLLIPRA